MDLKTAAVFNCYVATGFKPDLSGINAFTLSIAKSQGYLENTAITETYIYDECIFSTYLINEVHMRYNFVQDVITTTETAGSGRIECGPEEIMTSMLPLGYEISLELLRELSINPALTRSVFNKFAAIRVNRYSPLLSESLSNEEPLTLDEFGMGVLDQRDHPALAYLGEFSDNMINSLGKKKVSFIEESMFQTCLMTRYTTFLQVIEERMS